MMSRITIFFEVLVDRFLTYGHYPPYSPWQSLGMIQTRIPIFLKSRYSLDDKIRTTVQLITYTVLQNCLSMFIIHHNSQFTFKTVLPLSVIAQRLSCRFLGGLSLHLNHLIASRMANYDWPFGTLPFGLFG